ncbi:MAG: ribonuclease III domain-containing protein [Methanocorpusculum sp.]|uniref:ribonuclease III domain-containing protein n=1 Tax=Methanocorpusculum sp. TaxID=2058474 RepID=UPI002715665C|nr:ribonuclease III domain-containing protein [Methanocorpusculum sp.]MDO9522113.1 ribonuclease III domain-containing protein [Methanocorpusculum sp.]
MKYADLYAKIGYTFTNEDLLLHALTRTAYARENELSMSETMDSLAVLGDAVLDLIVIRKLIEDGEFDKGEITRKKIDLVNMTVVRRLAEDIGLPEYMRWGKGELRMQIWTSGRVSAECFEALMGAAYLDGGVEASAAILDHLWTPEKP